MKSTSGDRERTMIDSEIERDRRAIDQAIELVDNALLICDNHGFFFAAIDLAGALEKLSALREQLRPAS